MKINDLKSQYMYFRRVNQPTAKEKYTPVEIELGYTAA